MVENRGQRQETRQAIRLDSSARFRSAEQRSEQRPEHRPSQSGAGRDLSASISGNAAAQAESGGHCCSVASHAAPYYGSGFRNRRRGSHAETTVGALAACRVCGHRNREGNKFCGACGLPLGNCLRVVRSASHLGAESRQQPERFPANSAAGAGGQGRGSPRLQALPPARITTTITTIITISREERPKLSQQRRGPTLPKALAKPTA